MDPKCASLLRQLPQVDDLLRHPELAPAVGTLPRSLAAAVVRRTLAEARRTNRRIFLDFTGYTCTNCKWMETNMFPRDDVRRELERFVRLRLYTDGEGELYQKQQLMQQEKFKTVALPYYAILEADGTTVATFPGLTRDSSEFVRFLRQAQAAPPQT